MVNQFIPKLLTQKKESTKLDGEGRQGTNQEDQGSGRGIGYIQNAEQNETTLWKRLKA